MTLSQKKKKRLKYIEDKLGKKLREEEEEDSKKRVFDDHELYEMPEELQVIVENDDDNHVGAGAAGNWTTGSD